MLFSKGTRKPSELRADWVSSSQKYTRLAEVIVVIDKVIWLFWRPSVLECWQSHCWLLLLVGRMCRVMNVCICIVVSHFVNMEPQYEMIFPLYKFHPQKRRTLINPGSHSVDQICILGGWVLFIPVVKEGSRKQFKYLTYYFLLFFFFWRT